MANEQPKYDRRRGRHKKRASAETRKWEAEHLVPPCPPWLDRETYSKLARMREQ